MSHTRPARCNALPLDKGISVQFSSGKASSTSIPGRTFLSLMLPWRHRRKPDRNFQLQQQSSSCLPGLQSANICRWERREERAFAGSKAMGEAARRPLVRSKLKCCPGEEAVSYSSFWGTEKVPVPLSPSPVGERGSWHSPSKGLPACPGELLPGEARERGPQRQENIWHGDLWVGLLAHASPSPVSLLRVSLKSGCKVTEGGLTCLPDVS